MHDGTVSLSDMPWPQLDDSVAHTVLVPVGSTEQHGPHLPLDTDTRIATAVAGAAAGQTVLVGAPLPYGASGEHETFPGTVSIGTDALCTVLVELGRSACRWANRLVFVNGHGGNVAALTSAVALLRAEGRDVGWFGCAVAGGDGHAGRPETSMMLALAPQAVHMAEARPGNTAPLAELMPAMRAGSVRAVSENGVLGDPTGATAVEGEANLGELAEQLRRALRRWAPDGNGRVR